MVTVGLYEIEIEIEIVCVFFWGGRRYRCKVLRDCASARVSQVERGSRYEPGRKEISREYEKSRPGGENESLSD